MDNSTQPSGQSERELFMEALDKATPAERATYLDAACGYDTARRRRLERLLESSLTVDTFLEKPAVSILAANREPMSSAEKLVTAAGLVTTTEQAGDRIGRYKLLQNIGEGGCGVVYMAEQEEPVRRRVALKVIKLGMDTKSVIARFEAERQALAMMDHPNIAKVLDAGATNAGRPYFVMELVRGIKITEYCDQHNLPTRDRLELFIKACQAIQHAHQKGVIHRDIKPSNILVTLHDGVAVPKVIDFGIAKATTDQRLTDKTLFTALDQFIGTPAYMSPEQAEMSGLDIDTRSDIYSLGVLLYELLTGTTPFEAKNLMAAGLNEMRRTIREKEPVRPSTRLTMKLVATDVRRPTKPESDASASSPRRLQELITLIRGDVDWIVMKCLEKDRARRYETANGLAADIKRFLNHEPIMARPPSTAYRFRKALRRHKLAFMSAAAVGVVLLVGVMVSTWQAFEASRARDAEKAQRLQTEAEKITAQRHLYVANMNLAQQAWEQNNVDRLRQLLVETQDSPYRGFEWYFWQRQSHLALKTFRGHLLKVNSVAFSPDGQRIVTGSEDQIAKVWDVASGRELFSLKHSAPIFCVAFSPDGHRLVTSSGDQTAKVWDAANGRPLLTLRGHKAGIRSVAFSSDGQRIVTGGGDETVKVWDAASGSELSTLEGDGYQILSVAFSPDGQRIVTGTRDRSAKVWDAASGVKLLTLNGHSAGIASAAFSSDGQRIVTGSSDGTAKVWDAVNGRDLRTLSGHSSPILSVALSPDGQLIATTDDKIAKVWDATNRRELLTLKGHSAPIVSVAFSTDGQRIVTGSGDQSAKVWELPTFKGHTAPIVVRAFSPDAERTVTSSGDQTAKVWDAANGRKLHTLQGHTADIRSAAFSANGQRIVTGSEDQTARVWDAASGRELLTLHGHRARILSVAFSPDAHRIVTSSWDQTAKVWDAVNGRDLRTLSGHSAPILSVAFSPDGHHIVTGSSDRTAKVWDAASGGELLTLTGHTAQIFAVAFSPGGQRIVTGSGDRTAKVWDVARNREPLTLTGHSDWIGSVAFSPDAQRIVTGSWDLTAKVWEAASGRELLTLTEHIGGIMPMAFSPDGQRIVTSRWDQTAKVWQAASAEQVAAWEEEERAAAQYLAALQRERTAEREPQRIARVRDEGAIKRWLILAPIALATGQSEADGLDTEQIEGEGQLRPKAGETAIGATGALKWEEVGLEDYMIDFNVILGRLTIPRSVAYAVCYIRSEAEQHGLQMLVGSNDQSKVYLNGKQIHKYPFPRGFVADQDRVQGIVLNAGLNVLVFKVVNEMFDWMGSIRFTDAQGHPVKGIKVQLTD